MIALPVSSTEGVNEAIMSDVNRWVDNKSKMGPAELQCSIKLEPLYSLLNGGAQESLERVTRLYLSGTDFTNYHSPSSFKGLGTLVRGLVTAQKRDEGVRLAEEIRAGKLGGTPAAENASHPAAANKKNTSKFPFRKKNKGRK